MSCTIQVILQSLAELLRHQTSSRLSLFLLFVPKKQSATFPILIRGSGRYDPAQVSQILWLKPCKEKNTPKRIEWNLSEAYLLKGQLRFSGYLSLNGNAPFPSFCLQTLYSCGIYLRWRPSKIMAYNFLFHAFLSVYLFCCFADNSRWELTTYHWITSIHCRRVRVKYSPNICVHIVPAWSFIFRVVIELWDLK